MRISGIKDMMVDPLHSFRILQTIIAMLCVAIPLFLRCADRELHYPLKVSLMDFTEMKQYLLSSEIDSIQKLCLRRFPGQPSLEKSDATIEISAFGKVCRDKYGFRMSMSDYAYMPNSYIFGMLYMMAAMLYIYNGFVYMKRKEKLNVQRKGSYANVFIGCCLIGVIFNPQSSSPLWHNVFSLLFFVGNVCMMFFIPKQNERVSFKRIRISTGTLTVLIFAGYMFGLYTMLWAEWLSLFCISTYLILMAVHVHRKAECT